VADNRVIFEVVATAKGVKVVQKQTEQLAKSTERADKGTQKLTKSRDRYSRTEKGVANISSNSTKNFSKMQQNIDGGGGGGGLVRAYALLAANVFALTAAFGVLSRSAQIDTLTESMERLSATGGSSITAISRDLVEASGGAIAFADGMRQVALATSAGLGAEQIQGLTTVAKGAAIALGRDLNDSLDRIFRGAIKLEPELLDEIGLFVRVDEESSKYARTLGKSVTSLTQYEKRQAFLNGVLEQGTKKFQDFAEQVDPDPYSKLAAALGDIAQNVTSFVNKALGPLVSFLAESRGLLFGVFAVVATVLLKQAIPAISSFTANLERSAATALTERNSFIDAQKAKTAAAKQFALDSKKAEIDRQKAIAIASKAEVGGFTTTAKGALDPSTLKRQNLLKKEEDVKKRISLISQRQADLEKVRNRTKQKSKKLIDAELVAIKAEKRELEGLLRLERERLLIEQKGVGASRGTLSDIENQRTLNKAIVNTGVASVLSTAQNDGLKNGFSSLFKTLKAGEVTVNGNTEKLKGFSKASFALKGGIGLLGASFSRLLAFLGPIGIAFSLIAPFLPAIGRATNFVTKESQQLSKTYKSLQEQTKNLNDRFEIQTTAINNTKLSYVETRKAILAFNKTNNETAKLIIQSSNDLQAFQRNLSGLGAAWEGFKSIFGLDQESKIIKTQSDAVKEALQSAIQVEDEGILGIFKDIGVESESFKTAIGNATAAESQFEEAQKNLNTTGSSRLKILEDLAKKQITGNNLTVKESAVKNSLNETEKTYINTLANQIKTSSDLEKERKKLNITEDQANKFAKDSIPLTEARIEAEQKRVSALESSREAVSKFQAAFQQTTKVDEITASLNQLKSSIVDGADQQAAQDFFATFDKEPIALIFTAEQIKEIKEGGENAATVFNGVVKTFDDLKNSIATSKDELSLLNARAKQFSIASQVGGAAATRLAATQTLVAEKQKEIADSDFQIFASAQGISVEQAKKLALIESEEERKKEAVRLGKEDIDINKVVNEFKKSQNANLEYQFTLNTQNTRELEAQTKFAQTLLNTNKETANLAAQQVAAEAKIAEFKRIGSTTARASTTFENELEAARESLRLSREEADIKKTLIDVEFTLLKERVKLLNLEESERTRLLEGLSTAQTNAKDNVDKAVNLAASNFEVKILEGFKKGVDQVASGDFAGGLQTAITAATSAEGQGGSEITGQEGIQLAAVAAEGFKETLMSLGPQGEATMAAIEGALALSSAFTAFGESANMSDKLAAVGSAIGAISQMMAANSKAQIAEIDNQIAAEKKRDGKSKESMAKIAALEAKKLAKQKKAFEQNKKMKMAETVINTASAIAAALPNVFLAAMIGAMGAAQLALIAKTQFQGGAANAVEAPRATEISIGGQRNNRVDVARQASVGETAYLRGGMGVGSNANNFTPGAAMGRKGYANGSDAVVVGERGPEVISPSTPIDITPNYALGKNNSMNLTFNVSALDGASVQEVLTNNQGAVVAAIRDAANSYGQDFLPDVNVGYGGDG